MSFGINLDKKIEASIVGLRPIRQFDANSTELHGWQASLVITDNRYTLNNGYVYRKLSADKTFLYGANAFLDLEFPYQHRRASIGAEIKSSAIDLNFNHYIPITSWIDGPNGIKEIALTGTTLDVTTPVPYLPRIKANAKYSYWSGKDEGSDLSGMTYSLIGDVTPQIQISIQRRLMSGLEHSTALMVNYSLTPQNEKKPLAPITSTTPYVLRDMKDRMLETVKRENTIRKQYGGLRIVTR